jgi:hypothetical protein
LRCIAKCEPHDLNALLGWELTQLEANASYFHGGLEFLIIFAVHSVARRHYLDCWFLISQLLHDHCTNILNQHTLWLPTKTITRIISARQRNIDTNVFILSFLFAQHHTLGNLVSVLESLSSATLALAAGQSVLAFRYTPLISMHGVGFASSSCSTEKEDASAVAF